MTGGRALVPETVEDTRMIVADFLRIDFGGAPSYVLKWMQQLASEGSSKCFPTLPNRSGASRAGPRLWIFKSRRYIYGIQAQGL